jgi:hypothetical protein
MLPSHVDRTLVGKHLRQTRSITQWRGSNSSARSAHLTDPRQRTVLHVAAILRQEDRSTPFAFLLGSNVADYLIHAHRVSVFIKPPNGDAFFAYLHTP